MNRISGLYIDLESVFTPKTKKEVNSICHVLQVLLGKCHAVLTSQFLRQEKNFKKRPYAPGQHGQSRNKLKDYGTQLQEKQKVRFLYGVSENNSERLSTKLVNLLVSMVKTLKLLESRLDNVVYRLGLQELVHKLDN